VKPDEVAQEVQNWLETQSELNLDFIHVLQKLAPFTYYKLGGWAGALCEPRTVVDLKCIAGMIQELQLPCFVLGAGSNVLVSDEGFGGVVIRMRHFESELAYLGDGLLQVGAGTPVTSVLSLAGREGLAGAEFLAGIPGSMGGVVCMNAGTHLGEVADVVSEVECFSLLTGNTRKVKSSSDHFSYRRNHFIGSHEVVIRAWLRFERDEPSLVKRRIKEVLSRRKETQPLRFPSCGSVFKNPKKYGRKAWEVIESLGLRGHRMGGARFSEIHPNFIVNEGGASAMDVRGLIELAKKKAIRELSIPLEEEVQYIGFE